MSSTPPVVGSDLKLVSGLRAYIETYVESHGGSTAPARPANRVKFHWPPHPVSYSYHVLASDWSGKAAFEAHGETFDVAVARTPFGVFGRCASLWHEDRGESLEEMLEHLQKSCEPLFQRQVTINDALGRPGRFKGYTRNLPPLDLLKLLYCRDRDVANEARIEIETHASLRIFTPALLEILRDERHPNRRSAQWCVLDLFEDLPSFCANKEEVEQALATIRDYIWQAPDDYARAAFKAGVVLGGHLAHKQGGWVLVECLQAPSKIGRRSAIHGLFHVVEWVPGSRDEIVATLRSHALVESDDQLREFASLMADDIESGNYDHIPEPLFAEEG